jgi:hypothetical protein
VARDALGAGDQLAVDDQEAVIKALEEGLDEDGAGVLGGLLKGGGDGLGGGEVDGDAAAMVGVEGLDDDGVAERLGGEDGLGGGADHLLARHGEAEVAEDPVGHVLVRGDLDGDVAGLGGDRRLDPLLVAAVAELNERVGAEAQPGDVALLGGADEGGGGGAELALLGEGDELVEAGAEVELRGGGGARGAEIGGEEGVEEVAREIAGGLADLLLFILKDDVVLALSAGPAGLAEADLRAS